MDSGTDERRRKFYGWGYEGDEVSPREIAEFALKGRSEISAPKSNAT